MYRSLTLSYTISFLSLSLFFLYLIYTLRVVLSLAYHSFAWLAQEEEVVDKMLTTKSCKRRTCENNTNFVKDVAASYPSSVCKEIKLYRYAEVS